jgi:glycosyltransferase involved in cell wall biosynthesis
LKISIITIVLNQYDNVRETIESVLSQDVDVEYIIIDGGSTDGTLEVVQEYSSHLSQIISEPDGGIYDAINKGIRLATSDIIGLIHCGDKFEENSLKKVVEIFSKLDVDLVYGDILVQEDFGGISNIKYLVANHMKLIDYMSIYHPSTFISRKIYKKYGLYETHYRIAADYSFFLNLFLNKVKFTYISFALAKFRGGGISSSNVFLSTYENYKIRLKQIGFSTALKYLVFNLLNFSFYTIRKFVFISIFGNNFYWKIKNRLSK